ncbi:hypothetical protein Tco_1118257, partial [Tanacetum coccineum]
MHQFWNTIQKVKDTDAYRFKLDKKKFRVDTEFFHEILHICPRIVNQDFIAPPSEEELVTFIQEHGYSSKCISGKTTGLDRLRELRAQILWAYKPVKKAKRVKRPAKKSTTAPTTGVVIRDTLGVSVSKKKAPAMADRSKGIEILSDVALSEAAQLKEATKRSKKYFHISQASGLGDGTDFESGVPDEQQRKTSGDVDRTTLMVDSKDDNDDDSKGDDDKVDTDNDGNSDANDNERADLDDDDENPSFTLKDYDEEEHDEEYESNDDNENVFEEEDDDLYKDVDVRSLVAKHEKERKGDEEMIDTDHNEESSTQAPSVFTVSETAISKTSTAHATTIPPNISMITPLPQLTTPSPAPNNSSTTTSIPATSNFSSLFRLDQRVSTLETELSQLKQADHSAQLLESVKSQLPTIVDDLLTTSLTEFELKKILLDKLEKSKSYQSAPEHRELYDRLVKSYNLDKDLFSSYGNVYSLKRDRDDKDKDEDASARSDRGLKKQKTSKDTEPPKGSKS